METVILSAAQMKAEALRLGFSACGIAPADTVDATNESSLRQWLATGKQAGMGYMQNHTEKRLDPRLLMEGTQSIISVALNYYPEQLLPKESYQLAWYAYGSDYHDVMRAKLTSLQAFILAQFPTSVSRIFCDTAPVLERYWAWRAGLGWVGKHTQLILPSAGSCFFLGEIFIDQPTDTYDIPLPARCGSCTQCVNACPTGAIESPYVLNAQRCLSYLTIEHRGDIPPAAGSKIGNKIYGCDECQQACPWNRFATPCQTPELHPSPTLLAMRKNDWHTLTVAQYKALFKNSAVKRAKYEGLLRNITTASSHAVANEVAE
ncbi:tRNA epoxyqueuosine(34) reductase QueG [Bacteroides sp.]|uniref:tRNA epoxyqueuosine(34) reductase QueG n=1 Tax=Bacteroides sp. TaxID=29523 RepID=UPI001B71972F|nr:tRNA epoxyqueuosine(34) reductase QueG [Bacteroides sp.]MBP6064993.1 tRNA epoxyqueuosine(34) reductase QueG [Bacteroides sp.]MBP6067311.1 tRNA epoxyqueuosine(34) reductase QueG [Bacteroides sp.]MBP6935560.1 tRNA epoxyqueuosine(34) reductase QueG [Bacteroides sp.]MBP8621670.1 tRNA epoxyqueuosine(34) reductase QueG [Bacteroides sp.]MBP9506872.1 tRNA epoxyqueuosine(34) reductase QueG [Bacteroides sp.]